MITMSRKGYGRIYVDRKENIQKVKDIIKEIDEFEYDYIPKDFITVYTNYPDVVYTHKFCDMDMNLLTAKCWDKGIFIWVCNNGNSEYIYENN